MTTTAVLCLEIINKVVISEDPQASEEIYRTGKEYYQEQTISSATADLPGASLTEAAKLKGKIKSAKRQQTL